jgi:hypothetical protein
VALSTCTIMIDCIKALDLLLLFSSTLCIFFSFHCFQVTTDQCNFLLHSTVMEREGRYLVPRLRDLAFSVDIGYIFME